MKARRKPTSDECKLARTLRSNDYTAEIYGLSSREYLAAHQEFIQSEGYDDLGNEYETLGDYLLRGGYTDPTPWQKGDDYPA